MIESVPYWQSTCLVILMFRYCSARANLLYVLQFLLLFVLVIVQLPHKIFKIYNKKTFTDFEII